MLDLSLVRSWFDVLDKVHFLGSLFVQMGFRWKTEWLVESVKQCLVLCTYTSKGLKPYKSLWSRNVQCYNVKFVLEGSS